MRMHLSFYGPVTAYVTYDDKEGEWVAWADPFSEVGDGQTLEEAIQTMQYNLEDYVELVAEEQRKCDIPVQFLVPLSDDMKLGEVFTFVLIACMYESETGEPLHPDTSRLIRPVADLAEFLHENVRVFAGPARRID